MTIEEIDTKKVNTTVVDILENALEQARSGEIQSIAIAGVYNNGNAFNAFDAEKNAILVIGELSLLERDLIDLCCEIRKNISWDYVGV
ncbi:MAG: hypothetical protein GY810_14065 [Aureispira sp.]|nr:hypothetical protein [Aureispira sp.]